MFAALVWILLISEVYCQMACNDTTTDCSWRNSECERFTCETGKCIKKVVVADVCCYSDEECENTNCYHGICKQSMCTRGGYDPDLCTKTWRDHLANWMAATYLGLIFVALVSAASYGIYTLSNNSNSEPQPIQQIERPSITHPDRNIEQMREFSRRFLNKD